MEIKAVRDYLYKDEGEFSVLYDNIKETNDSFKLLLSIKEASSKKQLSETMVDVIKKINKNVTEDEIIGMNKLTDQLVFLIFKDIRECHKQVYE